jgi:hypothetical protein
VIIVVQDVNETLFYRIVMDNVTEMMPFICEKAQLYPNNHNHFWTAEYILLDNQM